MKTEEKSGVRKVNVVEWAIWSCEIRNFVLHYYEMGTQYDSMTYLFAASPYPFAELYET